MERIDVIDITNLDVVSSQKEVTICGRVMEVDENRNTLTVNDGTASVKVLVDSCTNIKIYDIVQARIAPYDSSRETLYCVSFKVLVSPENTNLHQCTLPEFRYWYNKTLINQRSKITSAIREFLVKKGFMEVQTPFLQFHEDISPIFQFTTAFPTGRLSYLRISPQEYLRRLLTVGFNAVFEIATNIRNDHVDSTHNPEFVSVEFMKAFRDLEYMVNLIEELFSHLLRSCNLDTQIVFGNEIIDFSVPWERITVRQLINRAFNVDIDSENYWQDLEHAIQSRVPSFKAVSEVRVLIKALEMETCSLVNPTFVTDFPLPLATTFVTDGNHAKRAELFVGGMEMANLGCDIYEKDQLANRYQTTLRVKQKLGFSAHEIDPELLRNFSYGCPPSVGAGIGIDRVIMLLTNSTQISEVILYPQKY